MSAICSACQIEECYDCAVMTLTERGTPARCMHECNYRNSDTPMGEVYGDGFGDNYNDNVDETNYDPYAGQDTFEVDYIDEGEF